MIRPFDSEPYLLFCLLGISLSIRVDCNNGNNNNDKTGAQRSEAICPKSELVVSKLRFGCRNYYFSLFADLVFSLSSSLG